MSELAEPQRSLTRTGSNITSFYGSSCARTGSIRIPGDLERSVAYVRGSTTGSYWRVRMYPSFQRVGLVGKLGPRSPPWGATHLLRYLHDANLLAGGVKGSREELGRLARLGGDLLVLQQGRVVVHDIHLQQVNGQRSREQSRTTEQ
eukprot:1190269-Prorocentrum_minimum.AAC.8